MRRSPRFASRRPRFETLEPRCLLTVSGPTTAGFDQLAVDQAAYAPSRILVQFRPDSPEIAGTAIASDLVSGLKVVELDPGTTVVDALAAYRNDPNVLYAEPDYVISIDAAPVIPNDPGFGQLWGLNNVGQTGGTVDADIDAPEAWSITQGSPSVIVAVIDTGVDYNHPDLAANIWTNTAEIPNNGIDDDGNGYADDIHGYDFYNNDGNPIDDNGHGSHVSGTIAAVSNNGVGVVGVAPNVRIMALKFLSASGNGYVSGAVAALNYAVAMGAKISNNSWTGTGYSASLENAIVSARSAGHIVVAAAGNSGANVDINPEYPAALPEDNIISVAATDANDGIASFSNYSASRVDLGAPGVGIYSTFKSGGYATLNGTSMATPHVTGVVALVRSLHPTWTYQQVITAVLGSVDPDPFLSGKTVTGGRLNAYDAVLYGGPPPPPTAPTAYDFGTAASPVAAGYTQVTSTSEYRSDLGYGWLSGAIDERDRAIGGSLTRDFNFSADGTFAVDLANGQYDVTVTLGDPSYAHGPQGVFLEGGQVDAITTAAGQSVTRTYHVTVADGQLTLRVLNQGSAVDVVCIDGLTIAPGTADVTGPRVLLVSPNGTVSGPIDRVTLTFNDAILDGSFTTADVVGITGPSGSIAVGAVNKIDAMHYEVVFAPQSAFGAYSVVVGPDIRDLANNKMDQNQNGNNGEASDTYNAAFTIAAPPPVPLLYDFGTIASPLASGYTQVTADTAYNATARYGWLTGSIDDRDRGSGSPLTQDFNLTPDGTFAVDLANGPYDVTVTLGDPSYAHGPQGIFLEGGQVDAITTAAGQSVTRTYHVTVADGQLSVRLKNQGSAEDVVCIDALTIAAAAADVTGPRVVLASPNGTVTGPIDRVTLTFNEAILDGSFTTADVVGITGPSGGIAVSAVNKIDALHYEVVFAPQSAFGAYSVVVGPDIRDLANNKMDQNQNGNNGEASDTYNAAFTIAATAPAPTLYDFGTAVSPLALGYTRVTATTAYNAVSRYGWLSGTIEERDRAIGSDLTRDFNFSADGTFAVDLANGQYDVTMTIGDPSYAHGPQGIFLEGGQVDTITTAAGQAVTRTYRVTVADGQLSVRLKNQGSPVDVVCIDSLQIAAVSPSSANLASNASAVDAALAAITSEALPPAAAVDLIEPGPRFAFQTTQAAVPAPPRRRPVQIAEPRIGLV